MPNPYENPELRRICGGALRPGGLELTREALDLCSFSPGARILDLGCGPGATLGLLRASGFKALGVDLSLGLLEEAREQGAVLRADFRRLPLRDAFADGLFCECSLSLAEDKSAALDEFSRVLKAGGLLVLSDLFIDRPEEEPGPRTCLAGAVSEEKMLLLLERAGFRLLHRRDCGQALKTLAARLIWEFEVAALPETAPRLCRRGPERAGKASPKTACLLLIAGRA